MSWSETDDTEIQENLDRLQDKQKELQVKLTPIGTIINNIKNIQTRISPSFVKEGEEPIKILPKDKWGEDMTDTVRLQIKKECIDKTIELLGEPDE